MSVKHIIIFNLFVNVPEPLFTLRSSPVGPGLWLWLLAASSLTCWKLKHSSLHFSSKRTPFFFFWPVSVFHRTTGPFSDLLWTDLWIVRLASFSARKISSHVCLCLTFRSVMVQREDDNDEEDDDNDDDGDVSAYKISNLPIRYFTPFSYTMDASSTSGISSDPRSWVKDGDEEGTKTDGAL